MNTNDTKSKKCPYCGKEFEPKVFWQKFCCPEHQKAYWSEMRKGGHQLKEKVDMLEKEIQELKAIQNK